MTTQIKFDIKSVDGTRMVTKINRLVAYVNKKVNSPKWESEEKAIKWAEETIETGVRNIAHYSFADRVDKKSS